MNASLENVGQTVQFALLSLKTRFGGAGQTGPLCHTPADVSDSDFSA
jgi:hypothetical protein